MTQFMPRSWCQRRRPQNPRTTATVRLILSICLLSIGLILTAAAVPTFQASVGNGTLGTYTVTGITGTARMLHGTFISANRHARQAAIAGSELT